MMSTISYQQSTLDKLLVLITILILGACATTKEIKIPQPQSFPIDRAEVATAAAVSIDITPPPGLAMGGYSIMANEGQGFRTRLKARVIYINDGKGQSTAIVQTDLTSASLLLHHQVASLVANKTGLKPGDIAITASHSHSAPSNHFENDFYNKHMSSNKWLNQEYFHFLSKQIADGVIKAYENRRPAKIATGKKDIYGYNRNRSIDAYRQNKNKQNLDLHHEKSLFEAVNPTLYMIRVDVKDTSGLFLPIAAFSSFSVHATALSAKTQVYNADLFAYAQKDLQWFIQNKYKTPWPVVHALTTGTQGDMAPALKQQGDNYIRHFDVNWKEARSLGEKIGAEAINLFEELSSQLTHNISLSTASREINIRKNNKIGSIELCEDAAIGSPVVGGAYERRTPWLTLVPFFRAGNILSHRWIFTNGCHGNKSHALFAYLQPLLEPKDSFPNTVLFQIIKINDSVILPLPFEVTIEAGQRITSRVAKEFSENVKYVWIASNANGYFGYTTTMEEYRYQNYEGGHTIYGQYTTPYLSEQLTSLSKSLVKKQDFHRLLPNWNYLITTNETSIHSAKIMGTRVITKHPKFIAAEKNHQENYIYFRWLDVGESKINFHKPLSHIEVRKNKQWTPLWSNGRPISDEGYDIEIRLINSQNTGMAEYEVRWYNPIPGGKYRFVIKSRHDQRRLTSIEFEYSIPEGIALSAVN